MYKKAMSLMVVGSFLFFSCLMCVKGTQNAVNAGEPVKMLKLELEALEEKSREHAKEDMLWTKGQDDRNQLDAQENVTQRRGFGIMEEAVSGQRVVDYSVLEKRYAHTLSDADMEALLRIVEAEAGCEDEEGKLLVANVVLNRVSDEAFPDTVYDVVFQQENGVTQFSPIADGRYYTVVVSEETVRAVGRALVGEDISDGALYFAARKYADSGKMKWFDENLTRLFAHGGHEFFK